MGKDSGGGSSQDTTTTSDTYNKTETAPWRPSQPYLRGRQDGKPFRAPDNTDSYMQAAYDEIFQNPAEYYPGQTYADYSPESEAALQGLTARGAGGSPVTGAAQGTALDTMRGGYLSSGNPAFQAMSNRVGDQVQQQVGSRFAGSGRSMGSPAEVQTFSREMANAMAPMEYQNYENERGNMMRSMMAGPELAGADYTDLNAMRQAGYERDTQSQRGIDESMARHDWQYAEPLQRLSNYGTLLTGVGSLGGSGSGSGSVTQTGAGTGTVPGAGAYDYASTGMSMLPMMMMAGQSMYSDRRLKRDIVKTAMTLAGLPVYVFRYLWSDVQHAGVMADDVRRAGIDAVSTLGGFDVVDYGRLFQMEAASQ